MGHFSLKEAAEEARMSTSTILRAIKAGRLSATRTDNGSYAIDPADLFRMYQVKRPEKRFEGQGATAPPEPNGADGTDERLAAKLVALEKAEVNGLPKLLAEMKANLDELRRDMDNLRRDLDYWQREAELDGTGSAATGKLLLRIVAGLNFLIVAVGVAAAIAELWDADTVGASAGLIGWALYSVVAYSLLQGANWARLTLASLSGFWAIVGLLLLVDSLLFDPISPPLPVFVVTQVAIALSAWCAYTLIFSEDLREEMSARWKLRQNKDQSELEKLEEKDGCPYFPDSRFTYPPDIVAGTVPVDPVDRRDLASDLTPAGERDQELAVRPEVTTGDGLCGHGRRG